jgi:hypothetical protein
MRATDEQQFASFVHAWSARLFSVASERTGDRGAAEAAVVEALSRAYRRWPRLAKSARPEETVERWVTAAAGRRSTVLRRRAAARGQLAADDALADRARLRARSARRSTTLAAAVGAVAVAVIASSALSHPTAAPRHGGGPTPGPLPSQSVAGGRLADARDVTAVAAEGSFVYVATGSGLDARISVYDRFTSFEIGSVDVPGAVRTLAVGFGTVWATFDPTIPDLRSLLWHLSGDLTARNGHYLGGQGRDATPIDVLPVGRNDVVIATDQGVVEMRMSAAARSDDAALAWNRVPVHGPAAQVVPLSGGKVAVLTAGHSPGRVVVADAGGVVETYRPRAGDTVRAIGPAGDGLWVALGRGRTTRLVRLDGRLRVATTDVRWPRAATGGSPRIWVAADTVYLGGAASGKASPAGLACLRAESAGRVGTIDATPAPGPSSVAVLAGTVYVVSGGRVAPYATPAACRAG